MCADLLPWQRWRPLLLAQRCGCCSGDCRTVPRQRELGVPHSGVLGGSPPSAPVCAGSFCSTCAGQGWQGGWRAGVICSFSVQTTNIIFSHLEPREPYSMGTLIRHFMCSLSEKGAVRGVERCLSTSGRMRFSYFSCVICLQAVGGIPQEQFLA